MSSAFVSYASEDNEFVTNLVTESETHGHRLWHFERDSKPAHVYLQEIVTAIHGCDLMILIASHAALDSFQVDKEVQLAHERNKKILLVLLGVTLENIESMQPGWLLSIGSRTHLRLQDASERKLITEIVRTLDEHAPPTIRTPAQWAADSTLIQVGNLEKVLFQTPAVKGFLEDDHQFFVSANKGVGKTLLLKSKRARLMAQYGWSEESRTANVLFMPQNKPYLEKLSGEWPSLRSDKLSFLATLRTCRRLWSLALRLSILTHYPDKLEKLDLDEMPASVQQALLKVISPRSAATIVFRHLLTTQTVTSIHTILDRIETNLERAFREIHSAVYCFIDTVEQGVSNLSRDAWISLQAGLLEAAWDVMTSNNHVKIYASIREEAFANYTSNSKINLYSATLSLRYTLEELRQIIDSLTQLYEQEPGFHQFVGRAKVRNLHCRIEEDSFRYVHRHTVGRPRDLVVICSDISRNRGNESEERFRETVNHSSSNVILPLVFEEMGVFLDCLSDEQERNRFFGLLSHNIMTRNEVERICGKFNGLDNFDFQDANANQVGIGHPFCEMYNCGLIGTVNEDRVNSDVIQEFKQPFDLMTRCESCLPRADYYLVHPSLNSKIQRQRPGSKYFVLRYIAVGHRYPWRHYFSEMVNLQKSLLEVSDTGIRESVFEFIEAILSETNNYLVQTKANATTLLELQQHLEHRNLYDVFLNLDFFLTAIQQKTNHLHSRERDVKANKDEL